MDRGGLEQQEDKVGEGEGEPCREASGCAGEEGAFIEDHSVRLAK